MESGLRMRLDFAAPEPCGTYLTAMNRFLHLLSVKVRHFFHVCSTIRPVVWLSLYIILVPLFALFYYMLPPGEFRIPDGGTVGYGSWLYYSIVTISTLGFGDYTPAMGGAQLLTACEVVAGLSIFGFFLNAVGSMRSEIDVESELEKQRIVHQKREGEKMLQTVPIAILKLNRFLSYCYVVTTPVSARSGSSVDFDENFTFKDLRDLYKPTGLPDDHTLQPAVEGLLRSAGDVSLFLDSVQTKIDLTIWPDLLEECFGFVANCQLFTSGDAIVGQLSRMADSQNVKAATEEDAERLISDAVAGWDKPVEPVRNDPMNPIIELYFFIKESGNLAKKLEVSFTSIANEIKQ